MLCCYAISQAITLMAPAPLPSQLFRFFFYTAPVNKLHLLHPTTCTLAHTYTHPGRQSRKLTFTLQQLTKGHEGPSFKSIYPIWTASVYTVSLGGCVGCAVYRGLAFSPSVVFNTRLWRHSRSRLTNKAHRGVGMLISSVFSLQFCIDVWNNSFDYSYLWVSWSFKQPLFIRLFFNLLAVSTSKSVLLICGNI